MTKLYLQREIRREDLEGLKIPEQVVLIASEYGRQLYELYTTLTANVDYVNLATIVRQVDFSTPADYETGGFNVISFPNTLRRKVIEVRIAQIALDKRNFSPILTAVGPSQIEEAGGNIRVLYIAGLSPSTDYKATLVAS